MQPFSKQARQRPFVALKRDSPILFIHPSHRDSIQNMPPRLAHSYKRYRTKRLLDARKEGRDEKELEFALEEMMCQEPGGS